ncbi:MAG: hypothetical protein AB7V42_12160 [Thermoleophilia bacterium]
MATRRLELGFEGGTVLRLTLEEEAAAALTAGLADASWREVEAEEGTFWVNQGELVYVRLAPGEAHARVGFGGS